MKWFKHISDSLDDPFISDLIDEFGSDGYIVFFGTLEMLSREFDVKSPGKVTVSRNYFRRKVRLSWHKCSTILKFCEKNNRIFASENGSNVTLNCPKLEEMLDDWTKRKLSSHSVVTPKILNAEEDIDKDIDKDKYATYAKRFEVFWTKYPKKKSKGQAEKTWFRIKPTKEFFEKILVSLSQAKKSDDWMKDNGQFIPYPATWLNSKGWEDEYVTPKQPKSQYKEISICPKCGGVKEEGVCLSCV